MIDWPALIMGFSALSEEVLALIIEELAPRILWFGDGRTWISFADYHTELQTLVSMSLVTKQLHRIVRPYFYRKIVVHLEEKRYVEKLYHILRSQPELAQLVEEVSFWEDKLWSGSNIGSHSASYNILALVPNIKRISRLPFDTATDWYDAISKEPRDTTGINIRTNFNHLKDLHLCLDAGFAYDLYPVFRLPNLERPHFVQGELCGEGQLATIDPSELSQVWNFTNPSIKRLSFEDTLPAEDDWNTLKYIAQVCVSLEALQVTTHYDNERRYGVEGFRRVISIFKDPIHNTVRNLRLYDEYPTEYPTFESDMEVEDILSNAKSLEHAELDLAILSYYDTDNPPLYMDAIIPQTKSLKVLKVRQMRADHGCIPAFLQKLRGISRTITETHPELKRIVIDTVQGPVPGDTVEELRGELSDKGVTVCVNQETEPFPTDDEDFKKQSSGEMVDGDL